MRVVYVWITAAVIIVSSIITWFAIRPEFVAEIESLDDEVGAELEGDAWNAYNYVTTMGINTLDISLGVIIVVTIVWALMSMQRTEEISGYYGRQYG